MRNFLRQCLPAAAIILLSLTFAPHEARAQAVGPSQVLFSEFRLSGPNGFADEYIEFYCNRDTACDLSGYKIVAFDPSFGDFSITFPGGIVIPARQYLLIGDDAGYSLDSYTPLDVVASLGGEGDFFVDNEGVQLQNPTQTTVIDSVGFIGGGGTVTYIEGTGLQRPTGARPNDQYAYVRRMETGIPQDTNNNANDFVLVSVTGTATPGITAPPVLGAPGPQGISSPVRNDATIKPSFVDPSQPATASPNRVRTGSGDSGTLSIRRNFMNNSGQALTSLRFRVVDVTTLNSPNVSGGAQQADLRLTSSGDLPSFVNGVGRTVNVKGTTLQFGAGAVEPAQPNGGGLNSTVTVAIPGGSLATGSSIDVQYLLNVARAGRFRFLVTTEASSAATPTAANASTQIISVQPKRSMGARQLLNAKRDARQFTPSRAKN